MCYVVELKDEKRVKFEPSFDKLELFLKYKKRTIRKIDAGREKANFYGQNDPKTDKSPEISEYFEKKQTKFDMTGMRHDMPSLAAIQEVNTILTIPNQQDGGIQLSLNNHLRRGSHLAQINNDNSLSRQNTGQQSRLGGKISHRSTSLIHRRQKLEPMSREKTRKISKDESQLSIESAQRSRVSQKTIKKRHERLPGLSNNSHFLRLPPEKPGDTKGRVFNMYMPHMPSHLK